MNDDALSLLVLLWWLLTIKIGLVSIAVLIHLLFPFHHEALVEACRERPGRRLLIGAGNLIAALIVLALLGALNLGLLVGLFLIALATVAAVALAIAYLDVGRRLVGEESNATRAIIYGGVVLELAFFVPLVGQLLQVAFITWGIGGLIAVVLARRRNRTTPSVVSTTAPGASGEGHVSEES